MRSRRTSAEHQEAVNRRLALLTAELSTLRPQDAYEEWADPTADGTPWWDGHTQVSRGRAGSRDTPLTTPLTVVPDPADGAPLPRTGGPALIPLPGRHAARRRHQPAWLEVLSTRRLLDPAHLAVVAVLVAVGLAVTCWWVVRADAEPV